MRRAATGALVAAGVAALVAALAPQVRDAVVRRAGRVAAPKADGDGGSRGADGTRAVPDVPDGAGTPGVPAAFARRNFAGDVVDLVEGPALAAGLLGGCVAGAAALGAPRTAAAAGIAIGAAAGFGALDDFVPGQETVKGLRGHVAALRAGRITTGGAKLIGIPLSALAAAALLPRAARGAGRLGAVALDAGLISGSANLINLLDLRPGRALKVGALAASSLAALSPEAGAISASCLGAGAVVAPGDLAGRTMAGDAGANALGAAIGLGAARALPPPVKAALLVGIAALTLASEKISFTAVIARTPVLRRIDEFGRPAAR